MTLKNIREQHARIIENEKLRVSHQIATFIIHDLRNLAATFSLTVENSAKNIKNETFLKQSFEAINNEVKRMQKMIDALLAVPMNICLEFQNCSNHPFTILYITKYFPKPEELPQLHIAKIRQG